MERGDGHLGEARDPVVGVAARFLDQVPDRHGDHDLVVDEKSQQLPDVAGVGDAGAALDPVADAHLVVRRVVGVDVGVAVSGWGQAGGQGGDARIARPGEPAEVAGLSSVEDVDQEGADGGGIGGVDGGVGERDGVEVPRVVDLELVGAAVAEPVVPGLAALVDGEAAGARRVDGRAAALEGMGLGRSAVVGQGRAEPGEAGGDAGSRTADDDVVDAEFEEVKDKKDNP